MAIASYFLRFPRRCFQCVHRQGLTISLPTRCFTTTASPQDEAPLQETPTPPPPLNPLLVSTPRKERRLIRTVDTRPRRRRRDPDSTPFEQLPYQCFQEARKILAADREEKLRQIEVERQRIARLQAKDPAEFDGPNSMKGRLIRMQKHLEHLKILADSNDPTIKKRFEDGKGNIEPILLLLSHSYRLG